MRDFLRFTGMKNHSKGLREINAESAKSSGTGAHPRPQLWLNVRSSQGTSILYNCKGLLTGNRLRAEGGLD
ncbi:hypothetical protein [Kamptonema formosum]|uniref:hypothetical protein n=1 Tax=Kamptonema formosum TaxID=331992 RepID=UPI00034B8304|nr:hypothetical protein [Oscillatoria sp. PCC 10802]